MLSVHTTYMLRSVKTLAVVCLSVGVCGCQHRPQAIHVEPITVQTRVEIVGSSSAGDSDVTATPLVRSTADVFGLLAMAVRFRQVEGRFPGTIEEFNNFLLREGVTGVRLSEVRFQEQDGLVSFRMSIGDSDGAAPRVLEGQLKYEVRPVEDQN